VHFGAAVGSVTELEQAVVITARKRTAQRIVRDMYRSGGGVELARYIYHVV
jgi:hypothetical protein